MSTLAKAIEIACKAHFDQVDKAGKSYILHPLRLMMKCQNEEEMMVAVLHDVVEDSDFSLHDLQEAGFSDSVIAAIDCLTKRKNEDYDDFIDRLSFNSLAKKVKIEDIKDNLDLSRISTINEKDLERIAKYHRALKKLER